jgi:hypothetical protein
MTDPNHCERHVLYRWWGDDLKRPLYIGITGEEWWRRTYDHARKQPWSHEIRGHTIEWYPTRSLALTAEAHAIRKEHPKYNVMHNGAVIKGDVDIDDVHDELFGEFYRPTLEASDDDVCDYCFDEICDDCCGLYAHQMRWTVDFIIRSFECDRPVAALYPTFCTDCVTAAIRAGHAYYVANPWDDTDYLRLPISFVDGHKKESAEDWVRVREARDAFRMRMAIVGGPVHGREF